MPQPPDASNPDPRGRDRSATADQRGFAPTSPIDDLPTPDAATPPAARNAEVPTWLTLARSVAVFNIAAVAIAGVLALGLVGYGLVHAGGGEAAGLLALLLGAVVVLGLAPLALFVSKRRRSHTLWHALGVLGMLGSMAVVAPLMWIGLIEPMWLGQQFKSRMQVVELVSVTTVPARLPLGAQPIEAGLHATVRFRVKDDVVLDRFGVHVLRLMNASTLRTDASNGLPFAIEAPPVTLSFAGRPLDAGVLRHAQAYQIDPGQAVPVLKAGEYRAEFTRWFWGLRSGDGAQGPCRDDVSYLRPEIDRMPARVGMPVRLVAATGFDFEMRRGHRAHALEGERFTIEVMPAAWQRALDGMALESCADRAVREARERIERQYLTGDAALSLDDNPLKRALCSKDIDRVRAVLARGKPRRDVRQMMNACEIGPDTGALHDLMMPVLFEAEPANYCRWIEYPLAHRKIDLLERLHAMGLPLVCATDAHLLAVLGSEDLSSLQPKDTTSLLAWFAWLESRGARLCAPLPDGSSLLHRALPEQSAEVIESLLDRGCDPRPLPVLDAAGAAPGPRLSAAMLWHLRTHPELKAMRVPLVASAELRSRLGARIGPIAPAEFTRVGTSGTTLIVLLAHRASYHAELLGWLASHGVALNATGRGGKSWYLPGYREDRPRDHRDHALDALSDAQLREVLAPVNRATGQAGRPLDAANDRSPGSLGDYLCRRGAVKC